MRVNSSKCTLDKAIKVFDREKYEIKQFESLKEAVHACHRYGVPEYDIYERNGYYEFKVPVKLKDFRVKVVYEDKNMNRYTSTEIVKAEEGWKAINKVKELPKYRNKNIKLIKVV